MKIARVTTYLCIASGLALCAIETKKENQASMKGLPQEVWLEEIICRNLEGNILKSIRDIWKKRGISKFYRDVITPENIVKCIKKRELEYIYGEPILQSAISVYFHEAKTYPLQVINILINGGFDPNLKNKQGGTALHQAAHVGETGIVKALLEHGAAINELTNYRRTPLISAIEASTFIQSNIVDASDTIKLLISKGADLNLSPEENKTVLEYAIGLLNKLQGRVAQERADEMHVEKLELLEKNLKKYIQIIEEAEKVQKAKK